MTNEQGQRRGYGLRRYILTIGVLATTLFGTNAISGGKLFQIASDYSHGRTLPAYQQHMQAQPTIRQAKQENQQLDVMALIHDYIDRRQGESAHYSAHQAGIKTYLQKNRHSDVGEEAIDGILDRLLGDKAEEIKKKNSPFSLYDLRAQSTKPKPAGHTVSPKDPRNPRNWKVDLKE